MDERTVPAKIFMQSLEVNVDNDELSDKDFRQFVRNTLPIIIFDSKKDKNKDK